MDYNQFKTPAKAYLPAPFWSWNDKLKKEELGRQIDEMLDKGWGSYFIHTRVGLITHYLSEEWFQLVRYAAETSYEKGLDCWLYDEDKWPSGFAGGLVPAMDDGYRPKTIVLLQKEQIGAQDEVQQTVCWQEKDYYIAIRRATSGDVWFNGESYVDLLNPNAVKAFLEVTHEKYREKCGQLFGKEIKGVFTDEACFHLDIWFNVPALPWSEYLEDRFRQEKGYVLMDNLSSLFLPVGDYERIRYDFFDVASRLFLDSFTKPYYQWCEEHNLLLTGHLMSEDTLLKQTQWLGMVMPHYKYMHWPGIDKLGRSIGDNVLVKQLTSVKEQLNKERALSEVFGTSGQQVSFFHRKWIADWEAVLGVDYVNHHLSLYSMRGERKRDFPPNFFYQQPWWSDEEYCSRYLGRLSYMAGMGQRDTDILLLHPIASLWSVFSPVHKENHHYMEKGRFDEPFKELTDTLLREKLDFHYGDELILDWESEIHSVLQIHNYQYRTVIVPPSLTWRRSTIEMLQALAALDTVDLIFLGELPTRVDGKQEDLSRLFRQSLIFHRLEDLVTYLDEKYSQRCTVTDILTGANAKTVLLQTRIQAGSRFTMMINTEEERAVQISFNPPDTCTYKTLYDLGSGKRYAWSGEQIRLEAGGSLMLSTEEIPGLPEPVFLESGAILSPLRPKDISVLKRGIEVHDENVFPLQDVTLYLAGEKVLENEPIGRVWHDHFYSAEEGTEFRAEYGFSVAHMPEGPITAVIELAENLQSIEINGTRVQPLKEKEGEFFDPDESWLDINFTRVPLTDHLKKGENILAISGEKVNTITGKGFHRKVEDPEKHRATEIEKIYLLGDFSVETRNNRSFFLGSNGQPEGNNLTEEGYPFYAGSATFKYRFRYEPSGCKKGLYLRINEVHAASINLSVNGQTLGTRAWPPYLYRIDACVEAGLNEIHILIRSTLFNVMGPNRWQGILDKKFVGPGTFVDFSNFTEEYQLLPFGLAKIELLEIP